jgi:hypothetical protein
MSEEAKKNFELLWQEVKTGRHAAALDLATSSTFYLVSSVLPDDAELKKTRVVSLINLSRFAEALDLCSSSGLEFERAYALYKLQQFAESLQLSSSRSEKAFRLLRAQTVLQT